MSSGYTRALANTAPAAPAAARPQGGISGLDCALMISTKQLRGRGAPGCEGEANKQAAVRQAKGGLEQKRRE